MAPLLHTEDDTKGIQGLLDQQFKMIGTKEKALTRIQEAYEGEVYTLKEFKSRKETVSNEIEALREAAKILELQLKHTNRKTNEERFDCINKFKEKMSNNDLTYEQRNKLYKTIISSIEWKREGNDIDVKVNFL